MSEAERVHAVEGLFAETADGPRLLGSECKTCATPYFPRSEACHNPECDHSDVQPAEFGGRGTVWSTCIQNYPPPPPVIYDEPFTPYGVAIVDMPNGLRVVGRLLADDPMTVEPDSEVELVIEPLQSSNEQGQAVLSWQFKPL
jgi:uncharacterized OB-fold protein